MSHPREITDRRLATLRRLGAAAKQEAQHRASDLMMAGAPIDQVKAAGRAVIRIGDAFTELSKGPFTAWYADRFFDALTVEDDAWLPKWAQKARVAAAWYPTSPEKAAQDAFEASGERRLSEGVWY